MDTQSISYAASSTLSPLADSSRTQLLNRVLMTVIIVGMLAHLLTLTIHPRVFIDEAWISNASWTWLTTGVNFDSMHAGVLDQFGYEWLNRFFVGQAPYVISFGLFGLGLFQARLVAWFFGAVLLFSTVMAARRLHGLTVGLLAAVFLMLSLPFLQASRWRQDIMLTAFVMLAFWLALMALQDGKLWAHFLAGFLLGVGLDVHQSATLFIPALAALYLFYYGKAVLVRRGTWAVGIGGAVGLAIFAAIHLLPSPETYSKLMSFHVASGGQAELPVTHPTSLIASLIGELGRYGFRRNPVDLVLIGIAGLWMLKRRTRADVLLLVFAAVGFADFVLFSGNKTNLYAIHMYPFFMLMVAVLFVSLLRYATRVDRSRWVRFVSIAGLVLYAGYGTFRLAQTISTTQGYDYYSITNQIRAVLPPQARVMGMPMWWFGLADYDYRSSLSLRYYEFYNDYDVNEALEVMHPDYIIFDEVQSVVLAAEGETLPPGLAGYAVPEEPFLAFLEERGERILAFEDPYHGNFEIYAIDWGQPEGEQPGG